MREALAFLFLILLVWLGWKQAFRDQVASFAPRLEIAPSRLAQLAAKAAQQQQQQQVGDSASTSSPGAASAQSGPAGAAPRDNSWMWKRSVLDGKQRGLDGR